MREQLTQILTEIFSPLFLNVADNTGRHAKHPGAAGGGGHFKVTLVSEKFEGKTLLEQHQMVHRALESLFRQEIHALALRTLTPAQWKVKDCRPGPALGK